MTNMTLPFEIPLLLLRAGRLTVRRTWVPTLLALTLISSPLGGQEVTEGPDPLTVTASVEVFSRYVFRGYVLDERGAAFQPQFEVGRSIRSSTTGLLRDLSLAALAWSSVHVDSRAYPGDLGVFEVDLGGSLNAAFAGGWTGALVYTSYLAPTGVFETIHELALEVGLPEVGGDRLRVSPRALVARELGDAGGTEDTYLQLGADLELGGAGPVVWTVPVTSGFSASGFYRNDRGGNEWFGFFGTGVLATVGPSELRLSSLPLGLTAGVEATLLNRSAHLARTASDQVLWTWRIGLSVAR